MEVTDSDRAIVVSTLIEAWQVIKTGLVKDGTVKDVRGKEPLNSLTPNNFAPSEVGFFVFDRFSSASPHRSPKFPRY